MKCKGCECALPCWGYVDVRCTLPCWGYVDVLHHLQTLNEELRIRSLSPWNTQWGIIKSGHIQVHGEFKSVWPAPHASPIWPPPEASGALTTVFPLEHSQQLGNLIFFHVLECIKVIPEMSSSLISLSLDLSFLTGYTFGSLLLFRFPIFIDLFSKYLL